MKTDIFPSIVGQESAKRKLSFYVDSFKETGIVPNAMFVAPKGCGKTTLAKAYAKSLGQNNANKIFIELNCSGIKNIRNLFVSVFVKYFPNNDVTILFDEASELPKDVTMSLLTVLNPNEENKNTLVVDDYAVDFDFKRHTFLFATSEAQWVFPALMDRLDRIDLEEYTYAQLGVIVHNNLPDVSFDPQAMVEVTKTLRGNARAAQKMATQIKMYLGKAKKDFTNDDWTNLSAVLGLLPLGLNRIELQLLRILRDVRDCSLTNLSAKTGLTRECVQRDFEMYLQKMNLMRISTSGRNITPQGLDYLKLLK